MSTVLDVSQALKNPGQSYPVDAGGIEVESLEVLGDPVCFENVALKGDMLATGESVSICVTVTAVAVTRCARCLGKVVLPIETDFDELFVRKIDPDDPDPYPFEGSCVELNEAVKNALVLALPYRIVCNEACKGLCPQCGKNLNEGSCTCQEGAKVMNPFSALKAIVENEEEV